MALRMFVLARVLIRNDNNNNAVYPRGFVHRQQIAVNARLRSGKRVKTEMRSGREERKRFCLPHTRHV